MTFYTELLKSSQAPTLNALDERHVRMVRMLAWGLNSGESEADSLQEFLDTVWKEAAFRSELIELLAVLDAGAQQRAQPSSLDASIPLAVHGRYSRNEIVAALAYGEDLKPKTTREGIFYAQKTQCDAFFIDLVKTEREYSPTTMYHDYAINRELFRWESQSQQRPGQPTVERYIHHREQGTNILLFVRERKRDVLGTAAFHFLGPVDYVDHEGERPVKFTWRLHTPMPEELFEVARSVAAA